jgi:hypothetical protein
LAEESVPPEPKVQVIIDPTDSPVLDAELARRADPPRGVVVVRPVPGVAKPADLAADVLIGLGKRFDALTREKKQSDGWRLAQMWLQAEDTRHVVIVDADRLPTPLWSALRSLARSLQSRLWLIGSAPPSPDQAHALGRHASVGLAEFLEALPGAPTSTPEEQGVEGPIPDDNFLTFRASCWDLLPAERFRAVDRIYRDTHWDARQVLDRSPGDGHVDPDLGQAVWVAIFGQDLRDAPEEGLVEAFRRNLVEARGGRARGSEPVKFSLVLTNRGH